MSLAPQRLEELLPTETYSTRIELGHGERNTNWEDVTCVSCGLTYPRWKCEVGQRDAHRCQPIHVPLNLERLLEDELNVIILRGRTQDLYTKHLGEVGRHCGCWLCKTSETLTEALLEVRAKIRKALLAGARR